MRLTDLLQLIDDLNINTTFYLKIDNQILSWSKLTIANNRCLLSPGKNAMTKKKLVKLVGHMHSRGIPLVIINKDQEIPIFGLQIKEETGSAVLM